MPGQGRIIFDAIQLPPASIVNEHISSSTTIDAGKLEHSRPYGTTFATAIGGAPATREEFVFIAGAAATIRRFIARLADTGTSSSMTFDLKVNGASVLSSVLTFTHSDPDGTIKEATIFDAGLDANDVVTVAITVSSSTGAVGPYAAVTIDGVPG